MSRQTVTENDINEIARMWCHLCLGVFQKEEPNVIIGWCGLDSVRRF